jgi:hypothetical protein
MGPNSSSLKRWFLCVDDYGMGGVWFSVFAYSAKEIEDRYPKLEVIEPWPDWMTDEMFNGIREKYSFDIDTPPPSARYLEIPDS